MELISIIHIVGLHNLAYDVNSAIVNGYDTMSSMFATFLILSERALLLAGATIGELQLVKCYTEVVFYNLVYSNCFQ